MQEFEVAATERDALIKKPENCCCAFWKTPVSKPALPGYATATGVSAFMGGVLLAIGILSETAPAVVGGVILGAVALASGYKMFCVPAEAPRPSLDV